MTIEIWLGIALVISLCTNALLVWFSREQSVKLSYVSQNLTDLVEIIGNYKQHLKKVYSLEMFYGDETLKFLMEHTNVLAELLEKDYQKVINITEPLEYQIIEEENEKESEESEVKDVFYAGSRRRDT